ncbi:MAG: type IV pilus assembly protein PilV [Halioglobus sp.]|jgi:type IV pilus assembly protein PilV
MALIEVLVAFGIFSVGVLGTFSMQIAAKRTNYDAAQQSTATALARDILARVRANPDVLDAYVVDDIGVEAPQAVGDCISDACSNLQLAQRDIYEWSESLSGEQERVVIEGRDIASGGLVDARACIKNEAGIVSVTISWRSLNGAIGASAAPCRERVSADEFSDEKFSALTMASFVARL